MGEVKLLRSIRYTTASWILFLSVTFVLAQTTYYWNPNGISKPASFHSSYNWSTQQNGSGSHPPSTYDDNFENTAVNPTKWRQWEQDGDANPAIFAEAGGVFSITGSGADLWDVTNQFNAIGTEVFTGDFDVSVKVASLTGTNPMAKAGLMVGDDLGQLNWGGLCVLNVFYNNNPGVEFTCDMAGTTGTLDNTQSVAGLITAPVWLRLVRKSQSYTAFYKTALNNDWIQVGTSRTPQSTDLTNIEVGLFVSARQAGTNATATFDDFHAGGKNNDSTGVFQFNGTGPRANDTCYVAGGSSIGSINTTGFTGVINWNNSRLQVRQDVTFANAGNFVLDNSAIELTGTGVQNVKGRLGMSNPGLIHSGSGTLTLLTNDYNNARFFTQTGGVLNLNNLNISTTIENGSSGIFSIRGGTLDITKLTSIITSAGPIYISGSLTAPLNWNATGNSTIATSGGIGAADWVNFSNVNFSTAPGFIVRNSTLNTTTGGIAENYSSWTYTQNIIINATDTLVNISNNLIGYPILLRLSASNFNFSQALTNGTDLRFATLSGKQLPYQIESWNQGAQTASIWIRLDTLYAHSTQGIKMYWGNAAAKDAANPAAVWGNEVVGIWHMSDTTDGSLSGLNARKKGAGEPINITGISGGALDFDGVDDFLEIISSKQMDFGAGHTISAWVRWDGAAVPTWNRIISRKIAWDQDPGWEVFTKDGSATDLRYTHGGNNDFNLATNWAANNWEHFAISVTGTTGSGYGGGVLKKTNSMNPIINSDNNMVFGDDIDFTENNFNGAMDEIRIYKKALSADWIKMDFESQKIGSSVVLMGQGVEIAPYNLSYRPATTLSFLTGVTIPPCSLSYLGNAATGITVTPALPTGLTLNPANGIITGTPTITTARANYTVEVVNGGGNGRITLSIEVQPSNLPASIGYSDSGRVADSLIAQDDSGKGVISIPFKVKDRELDLIALSRFQFQIGSEGWIDVPAASLLPEATFDVQRFPSATTFAAALPQSLRIRTNQSAFPGIQQQKVTDVRFRFKSWDGKDSGEAVTTGPITIDNANPIITFAPLTTPDPTPSLNFSANEALARATIAFNGTSYVAHLTNGTVWQVLGDSISATPDGTYSISITAYDIYGNTSTATFKDAVIISSTLATVTVNPIYTKSLSPALSGQVSDAKAIVTVTIGSNQDIPASVGPTGAWTITAGTLQGLSEGVYDVVVKAVTTAGPSSDNSSNEVVIDVTKPGIGFLPMRTNQPNPVLSGTIQETDVKMTVTLDQNNLADATVSNDGKWTVASGALQNLTDGYHRISIYAIDSAGNDSTLALDSAVMVDATPPDTVVLNPRNSKSTRRPTLQIQYSENVYAGTGELSIYDSTGALFETISVLSSQVQGLESKNLSINLSKDLNFGTKYYVNLTEGFVKDQTGNFSRAITGKTAWQFNVIGASEVVLDSISSSRTAGIYKVGDSIGVSLNFSAPVSLASGRLKIKLNNGKIFDEYVYINPFANQNKLSFTYVVALDDQTNSFNIGSIEVEGGTLLSAQGFPVAISGFKGLSGIQIDGKLPFAIITKPSTNTTIPFAEATYEFTENLKSVTMLWSGGTSIPDSVRNVSRILSATEINLGVHKDVRLGRTLHPGGVYRFTLELEDLAGNKVTQGINNVRIAAEPSAVILRPRTPQVPLDSVLSLSLSGIDVSPLNNDTSWIKLDRVTYTSSSNIKVDSNGLAKASDLGVHKVKACSDRNMCDSINVNVASFNLRIPAGTTSVVLPIGTSVRIEIPRIAESKEIQIVPSTKSMTGFGSVSYAWQMPTTPLDTSITVKIPLDTNKWSVANQAKVHLYVYDSLGGGWIIQKGSIVNGVLIVPMEKLQTWMVAIDTSAPKLALQTNKHQVSAGVEFSTGFTVMDNMASPMSIVHWAQGGTAVQHDTLKNTPPKFTFASDKVGERGLWYVIEVSDGNASVFSDTIEVEVAIKDEKTSPVTINKDQYVLFSVPGKVGGGTTNTILQPWLGQADKKSWRLYDYGITTAGSFTEFDYTKQIESGRSYWLQQRIESKTLKIPADSLKTLPIGKDLSIPLANGWNCISNPHLFPLSLTWLIQANQSRPLDIWVKNTDGVWDPLVGSGSAPDSIKPWYGYVLWNEGNHPKLQIPSGPKQTNVSAKLLSNNARGAFLLSLKYQDHIEGYLQLGYQYQTPSEILAMASMENKPSIWLRQLKNNESLSLSKAKVIQSEKLQALRFAASDEGWVWPVSIESNQDAVLQLSNRGSTQKEMSLYIIDSKGQLISPKDSVYQVSARNEIQSLYVLYGTKEFLAKQQLSLAFQLFSLTLGANYPNPIRHGTQINYSLPGKTTDGVIAYELTVMDIRGRQVSVIQRNTQYAGTYSLWWDGKNNSGKRLSGGVYYLQLNVIGSGKVERPIVMLP